MQERPWFRPVPAERTPSSVYLSGGSSLAEVVRAGLGLASQEMLFACAAASLRST